MFRYVSVLLTEWSLVINKLIKHLINGGVKSINSTGGSVTVSAGGRDQGITQSNGTPQVPGPPQGWGVCLGVCVFVFVVHCCQQSGHFSLLLCLEHVAVAATARHQ